MAGRRHSHRSKVCWLLACLTLNFLVQIKYDSHICKCSQKADFINFKYLQCIYVWMVHEEQKQFFEECDQESTSSCIWLYCLVLCNSCGTVWCRTLRVNVPATCECVSGTCLFRQLYTLPHWDRSCRSNFLSHPMTIYWQWADRSQLDPLPGREATGVPVFK